MGHWENPMRKSMVVRRKWKTRVVERDWPQTKRERAIMRGRSISTPTLTRCTHSYLIAGNPDCYYDFSCCLRDAAWTRMPLQLGLRQLGLTTNEQAEEAARAGAWLLRCSYALQSCAVNRAPEGGRARERVSKQGRRGHWAEFDLCRTKTNMRLGRFLLLIYYIQYVTVRCPHHFLS